MSPWTAPPADRPEPPDVADERTALPGWLAFHRHTLLLKCVGLTGDQLALRSVPPSDLSLLGLLRHLADVERSWVRRRVAGEDVPLRYTASRDEDLDDLDPATAEAAYDDLVAEWAACDRVLASTPLDATFEHRGGGTLDVRWVWLHLIEEYARHNGHADLLRELVDGVTGE